MATADTTKLDAAHAEALGAMLRAPGKPNGPPQKQHEDDRVALPSQRTLIATLQDMAARDADDYASFIESVRAFVQHKRAELDRLERLMGTKS